MTDKDFKSMADEDIIECVRMGDGRAAEYLLEKYKELVKRKARTLYLIGGDNDDLIQEGMIGLYKAIQGFDETKASSFYHFAQICVNCQLYTAVEASQRKKHSPLNSYISLDSVAADEESAHPRTDMLASGISPEELVIGRESAMQLKKEIMENLSVFEREVIKLYLGGDGYIKIAEKLNRDEKSIDNALQRVKTKIRNYIGGKA